jgi:hypothetical protein
MRAWIESEPASSTEFRIDWVNILEELPFIHKYAGILEAGAVFQPPNIAAEEAGSASLQTAHEDILVVIPIVPLHSSIFFLPVFL